MATCSICLRETTPYRDRTGTLCDRSAPDGDPIQCVSVGQRAWQARAEELERELAANKLDVHTVETSMSTVADLASRLESALARAERAKAKRDALLQRAEKAEAMVSQVVSLEKCSIDDTESKLTIASRTLQGLLSAWGDLLIENKARNFLCIDFVHDELGIVHVTVQLDYGETPVQQRDYWRERAEKAEAERDGWSNDFRLVYKERVRLVAVRDILKAERDALRAELEEGQADFLRLEWTRDELRTSLANMRERAEKAEAERDAIRAELGRLTTWHPASEPPDTDRRVLVWSAEWGDCTETDRWRGDRWAMMKGVTHWCEMTIGPEVTP